MEPFSETERAASVKRAFDEDTQPEHTNKIVKMNVPLKSDFDRNSLKHALASLFTSGSFSDLKVTCKGRTWNVHKCIVVVRCPSAKMVIKAGQLEYGMSSSPAQATLNMDEDDPNAVDSMLYYLYTRQIDFNERFMHKSADEDVQHLILALSLGDKYDLPLFGYMAWIELEARIKASGGMVLPQIVRTMHLDTASKSVVAVRDLVIAEAATLFCQGGQFETVMEAMALEFPKFGFDVLSHATKNLMQKMKNAEEKRVREVATDEEEDEGDEPVKRVKQTRYGMRTKAAPQKGRGRAKAGY